MFDFFLIACGILVRVRTTSIRRAILANKSKGLKKQQTSLFLLEHLARNVRREILGKGDEFKVSGGTA